MHDQVTGAAALDEVEAMTRHLLRDRRDGPEIVIRIKQTAGAGYLEIGGRVIGRVSHPDVVLAGAMFLQQLYREFLMSGGI
jgi:hypothetical protein